VANYPHPLNLIASVDQAVVVQAVVASLVTEGVIVKALHRTAMIVVVVADVTAAATVIVVVAMDRGARWDLEDLPAIQAVHAVMALKTALTAAGKLLSYRYIDVSG